MRSKSQPKSPPLLYTYRIDRSGEPGTIHRAKYGPVLPDNTVVPAGISHAPPGFTATATANVDSDETLDQWHINDRKEGLSKADVNDVPRTPEEYWRAWLMPAGTRIGLTAPENRAPFTVPGSPERWIRTSCRKSERLPEGPMESQRSPKYGSAG